MKRDSSNPYIQLISGIIYTFIGIMLIAGCVSYSPPPDYAISILFKGFYYTLAEEFSEFGILLGVGFFCCGVGGIILGIRGIHKEDFRNLPTEEEIRLLLEKGELTQEEYNEINEYKNHKK